MPQAIPIILQAASYIYTAYATYLTVSPVLGSLTVGKPS